MAFYFFLFTNHEKYDKTTSEKNLLKRGESILKIKDLNELQTYANKIRRGVHYQ